MNRDIIIFDGDCALCNRFISFLIQHDTNERFLYVSNQSIVGNSIIDDRKIKMPKHGSIILIRNEVVYVQSDAVILTVSLLDNKWRFIRWLKYVPKVLRDYSYNMVARSRYTIFGKQNSCAINAKMGDNVVNAN